nr:hypothetical protein GCM10020185_51070 [Pseudomonas brassicacearum subsp. brassicacearum]
MVVQSLLFIENRFLLDPKQPLANPAVDWPRFGMAAWSQVAKLLSLPGQSAGGSTLATQLEKYRHSPEGLTVSGAEKNPPDDFRQRAGLSGRPANPRGAAADHPRLPQQRAALRRARAW